MARCVQESIISEIRIARPEEKGAIQLIYQAVAGQNAVSDEARWDQLIQRGGLVVATVEGRIIGFGGIDVLAAEQLKWLYLLQQHQGSGFGSRILRRLESIAWESGLDSVKVHSAPGAVDFYGRHGYSVVDDVDQMEHDHEGVEMMKERA